MKLNSSRKDLLKKINTFIQMTRFSLVRKNTPHFSRQSHTVVLKLNKFSIVNSEYGGA